MGCLVGCLVVGCLVVGCLVVGCLVVGCLVVGCLVGRGPVHLHVLAAYQDFPRKLLAAHKLYEANSVHFEDCLVYPEEVLPPSKQALPEPFHLLQVQRLPAQTGSKTARTKGSKASAHMGVPSNIKYKLCSTRIECCSSGHAWAADTLIKGTLGAVDNLIEGRLGPLISQRKARRGHGLM